MTQNSSPQIQKRRPRVHFAQGLFVAVLISLPFAWYWSRGPFQKRLTVETLEPSFPSEVDTESSNWNVLPFGYTLAAWPKSFHGEPIVSQVQYHKGPPKKFIQEIKQIWRPVEVEVEITGPHTVNPKLNGNQWRACFLSAWSCSSDKQKFAQVLELNREVQPPTQVTWFESKDPLGARGLHVEHQFESYQLHRFAVITDQGVAQSFKLKAVKTPIGDAAFEEFLKIMGGMKARDELNSSKVWIQNRIKSVRLDALKGLPDPKRRLERYIEIQNLIASHLSVDPSQFTPYFHLAGVTHLLGIELYRSAKSYFGNQESWTLNIKPQLEALIQYGRDFKIDPQQIKNLEALLQDILLLQQKLSTGQKLSR